MYPQCNIKYIVETIMQFHYTQSIVDIEWEYVLQDDKHILWGELLKITNTY